MGSGIATAGHKFGQTVQEPHLAVDPLPQRRTAGYERQVPYSHQRTRGQSQSSQPNRGEEKNGKREERRHGWIEEWNWGNTIDDGGELEEEEGGNGGEDREEEQEEHFLAPEWRRPNLWGPWIEGARRVASCWLSWWAENFRLLANHILPLRRLTSVCGQGRAGQWTTCHNVTSRITQWSCFFFSFLKIRSIPLKDTILRKVCFNLNLYELDEIWIVKILTNFFQSYSIHIQ